ncbi:SDR family NAD(P)-dependent oxidoreductase [Saccharopolyspora spinosa]|uniref:NAD(P)-dependent dehydrogenase (Short-subunit alcohol dehydrogenase family) n=1 Tax=Saccharopolyspora spinosa TaxID=60894 RepID=A0A2N3Y6T3_SACSN|nr:SDR family NAD(P)-dependent oxidoreductase [Saccharopolyspora spinosa]PKW18627.1 NAD(P)-dependent dehydrogenase (short-subunit alcohol dehydrogenase family) [Saccharopolyspora spinosa]
MRIDPTMAAVVTGGASGLGEATVRRLYREGASVVIADLPCSSGQSLADALGERAVFVPADVREEAGVSRALDAAEEFGGLRVVITCAGIATPGRILGSGGPLSLDEFKQVLDINLVGTVNVLRLAAARMSANEPVDGDRGAVIMTSSISAYDGQIGQAAYAASKGGIAALTLSAARDLAEHGIRVNTIAPGIFATPLMLGLPDRARKTLEQRVPHPPRLGTPEEFASLAAHIIDNQMINGEVIRLDGALRMPPK